MRLINSYRIAVLCTVFAARAASAQTPDFMSGQSTNTEVVKGAPYSAEGTTTVKARLFDGTRIERSVTARFYRDSQGRVRREQTVLGLETLDPAKDPLAVVIIVDPVAGYVYTLVPGTREAHRLSFPRLSSLTVPAPPITARTEPLGERIIDGEKAVGTRTTITIVVGEAGNDRPITIVEERWDSVDLKMVLMSRHSNPYSGDVEFKLTKIKRGEPSPDLFQVPSGYTIRDNLLR